MRIDPKIRNKVLISFGLVLADQVMQWVVIHDHLSIINNRWLHIGLLSWLVAAIALVAAWLVAPERYRTSVGWYVIAAGLVSNFITSFLQGGVMDYLPFGYFIINISDVCIIVGSILVVLSLFNKKTPRD